MSVRTRLRSILRTGTGRRRRAARRPLPAEEFVPIAALMRPTELMVNDLAWCPTEDRPTLHAFHRMGGRQCWTCRTFTGEGS